MIIILNMGTHSDFGYPDPLRNHFNQVVIYCLRVQRNKQYILYFCRSDYMFCFDVLMISFYLKIFSIKENIIPKGCYRSVGQSQRDLKLNHICQYQSRLHLYYPKLHAVTLVPRSENGYLLLFLSKHT